MPSTKGEEAVILCFLWLRLLLAYRRLLRARRRIRRPLAASASEWDLNMWDDSRCWSLTRFHLRGPSTCPDSTTA
ncbi:uncharacterized protein N7515_008900 [Penicillium bovifimosum]|uniref:Uncharacterized protein n=1 Tax=Penicillium bovifimosum TaxID=126998 RepID=A0A9W9GNV0_9EURO|nr:uncharacterized protein N7515_008900 [Penicillium bovifimosum]KAJ5125075.1 hypothetical protein N7515_008900 [Penicillium bovifimosum]